MDTNKRISVVMCTYNGATYIRQQLDSILNQSRPIDELIIIDDCSTDDTYTIIKEYAQQFPIIAATRNDSQQGINPNFFAGISKATGDYIAISDQDDIWALNKIELQMKAIGNNLLCSGRSKPFSSDGSPVRFDSRIPNHNLLRFVYVGSLPGHTLFFSRQLLAKLPDISEITHVRCYDVILTMVAGAFNSIVYINEVLVHHRRHSDAATYSPPTDNRFNIKNILQSTLNTYKLHRELKPEIKKRLTVIKSFLSQIRSDELILKDAIHMIEMHTSDSMINQLKLSFFCLKHRQQIFFAPSKQRLVSALRALYFPISCSEYYRHLSKDYKK